MGSSMHLVIPVLNQINCSNRTIVVACCGYLVSTWSKEEMSLTELSISSGSGTLYS